MHMSLVGRVLSVVAVLSLMGAGCTTSSSVTPGTPAPDSTNLASTSTISVTSPKAGSTVTDEYTITGQAPAGKSVYVAVLVGENPVSLTYADPDAAGNFTMPSPIMTSVPDGAFTLEFYNVDDNYDWVNTLLVPLKLAR
ncbi:MAG: hypothetical protein WC813_02260 [Patescibacteria group bacterium]|jgi:hypothetical protein